MVAYNAPKNVSYIFVGYPYIFAGPPMKAGWPTKMQVTSLEAKNSMISENVRVHFEVPPKPHKCR